MQESFTIGELAARVTGGNEAAMRKVLNDAGADPRLDEYATDPTETVTRDLVLILYAMRVGDRAGRKLGETMD